MTKEDFDFWAKAFLAAMNGELSCQNELTGEYTISKPEILGKNAAIYADAALAVWREKRAELEREHVEKVANNG